MITEDQKILLEKIYFDSDGRQGAFSSVRPLYLEAKKIDKSITYNIVKEYLKSVTPYVLHKRVLRKFPRRTLLSLFPNNVWCLDTVFYV